MGDDASLGDLLAVLVVEDHAHGVLEVLELFLVDALDLGVADLALLDEGKEDVGGECLDLEVELFGDLALLEALVDPPNVLAEGRVVVIFNAVVRPAVEELGNFSPLVAVDLV